MKLYVGVTDRDWYEYLAARRPDEVNFWRPGGTMAFRALEPGAPFLFKLHSPLNFIAGGGFFVKYSALPLSIAWAAFGSKNGAEDFDSFRRQILKYRARRGRGEPDPQIGCIVLAEPFFYDRELWIPTPAGWHPNLVQGRSYDTDDPAGAALWDQVQQRLAALPVPWRPAEAVPAGEPRYGQAYLHRARLGQGAFRVLVTDAYQRRCAITGERTLPVLEAAHIKPFTETGPHHTDNGLLLRADLHLLFDRGYLTVTPDLHAVVSPRIKEEWENGREYYALHGRPLAVLPARPSDHPAREFIEWHNQHVYSG